MKKLIIKDKQTFEVPKAPFFENVEIIENAYLPNNECFLVFSGNSFIDTTLYVFKYVNGELCYKKIPPLSKFEYCAEKL